MVAWGCVVAGGHVRLLGGVWLWGEGMCGCWGGVHGCQGGMHGCGEGGMHGCVGQVWLWVGMRGGQVEMHGIRRDTVNEWAVRILLECILVNMYLCKYLNRKWLGCHADCQDVSRYCTRDESEESISRRGQSMQARGCTLVLKPGAVLPNRCPLIFIFKKGLIMCDFY